MKQELYTNKIMRRKLMEFLEKTFDYDGKLQLLAVSARRDRTKGKSDELHWKLRIALTYREDDTKVNPYWDGTELEIALAGDSIWLLEESALIDEPPIIEGSPNALALEWVSEIAPPLWLSDEARKEATAKVVDEATRVNERSATDNLEDPFGDSLGK